MTRPSSTEHDAHSPRNASGAASDFAPLPAARRKGRRWFLAGELVLLLAVILWAAFILFGPSDEPRNAVGMKVQLHNSYETVYLHQLANGQYRYQVNRLTGPPEYLTPQAFSQRVFLEQHDRGIFSRVLNITSPMGIIWVGLGLLGQVLFTGRMVVQWLASEKSHRSVVPPAFWWMSLVGATMLMIYFIWRKDAVGVLGQSAGWFIYVRNLWMIYNPHPQAVASDTAADQDDPLEEGQPESPIGLLPENEPANPADLPSLSPGKS